MLAAENDIWYRGGICMNANSEVLPEASIQPIHDSQSISTSLDPWKTQFGIDALFPPMNEGKSSGIGARNREP